MSSDLIIDFNGYFESDDNFKIKELSMYELKGDTCDVEYGITLVSEPSSSWKNLESTTKSGYEKYFNKYGVAWEFGTDSSSDIYNYLLDFVLKSTNIYVLNEEQKILLLDFLVDDEDMPEIVCLEEDLGYDVPLRTSTTCFYHRQPHKNNCPNDNLEDMIRWLKASGLYKTIRRNRMHMVIDFIGYDLPHGVFGIKEFCAVFMDYSGSLQGNYHKLVKPPPTYQEENLPLSYQISYDYFKDRHGIPWKKGDLEYHQVSAILRDFARNGTYIYVRNFTQRKLLKEFIGDVVEIVPLDKFGFDYVPKMSTICSYHKRGRYNCAGDNSWRMIKWLKEHQLYQPNERKNYSNRL